jgi:hypothetical protein
MGKWRIRLYKNKLGGYLEKWRTALRFFQYRLGGCILLAERLGIRILISGDERGWRQRSEPA